MAEGGIDTSIPGHSGDWALWKRKIIANRKYNYAMVKVKCGSRRELGLRDVPCGQREKRKRRNGSRPDLGRKFVWLHDHLIGGRAAPWMS